jgi:RNA polymerase sigma-70 factor, ECF subfamily
MDEARRKEFQEKALPLVDELYGAALRMAKNPQAAEDLVSDAFAKAWKSLDQFQPGTNIRAWLYRILTNAYINNYRKKHREPEKVSVDAYDKTDDFHLYNRLSARAGGVSPDPVKTVIDRLTDLDFRRALDALPEEYRTAVVLYDLQGLSYQEAAESLDVPLGTVRSRLSRGRKMLQKALWKHAQDAGLVPSASAGAGSRP